MRLHGEMNKIDSILSGTKEASVYSLDWLRGIAALMVCIFHVKKYVWLSTEPNFLVRCMNQGYLGVYMFFIVSGFVIPYSMDTKNYRIKSFGTFLWKRTIRIEPPYILFILLLFLWNIWMHYVKGWGTWQLYDLKKFLLNVTYLAPFFHEKWIVIIFWTLGIEFQFYLLSGLIQEVMMKNGLIRYTIMVVLILVGLFIPKEYATVFHFYSFFALGFQSFLFLRRKIFLREYLITSVVLITWIFFHDFPAAAIITVLTLPAIYFLNVKNTVAHFFGKISYSLYLTHGLAGGAAGIFLFRYFNRGSLFFICLGISILFAFIYYRFVEKPFLVRSKKIHY